MLQVAYLPMLVFLVDIVVYIWCSIKLHRAMRIGNTTWMLLCVLIVIYSRANGIINISDNFAWISLIVMIALGTSISDQYKRYLY